MSRDPSQDRRSVVLFVAVSIDGFIARKNHDVSWLFTDQDYGLPDFLTRIDTLLVGRTTYEVSLQLGMPPGQGSTTTYVFSRTLPPGARGGVMFTDSDPAEFVRKLRKRKGRDIWLMGGGVLAARLLEARLVDEMILAIHPVVLGEGIPLFLGGHPSIDYQFVRAETFSSGLVELFYRRKRVRSR